MARDITINRDQSELLVELLEANYISGDVQPSGVGADLAYAIRKAFGMAEQPTLDRRIEDD